LKNIGAGLLIIGIIILIGYGFYEFMSDLLIPMVVKISIIALVMGIIIILSALIIEKFKDRRGK
jgi:hypothetical protein